MAFNMYNIVTIAVYSSLVLQSYVIHNYIYLIQWVWLDVIIFEYLLNDECCMFFLNTTVGVLHLIFLTQHNSQTFCFFSLIKWTFECKSHFLSHFLHFTFQHFIRYYLKVWLCFNLFFNTVSLIRFGPGHVSATSVWDCVSELLTI